MGMGFAPTWLRQVSPLLHKTTLTTGAIVTVSLRRDVFEIFEKCRDLETRVRVTLGHRNRHRSIRHPWFPVNVPQQPWAYLVPIRR